MLVECNCKDAIGKRKRLFVGGIGDHQMSSSGEQRLASETAVRDVFSLYIYILFCAEGTSESLLT